MNQIQDQFFLKKALELAQKGTSWTNPNPMVGALIVKGGKIVASGYHKKFGGPHAEIEAINSAKIDLKGATLYINLEPCCHFGKTPPCTDAIIQAGISRVVCSTLDPNPKVSGKGIKQLKKAGLDVLVGGIEDEAKRLNEAFFTFHQKGRPFIALKFAASLDGKIATKTGDSRWITNEKARLFARKLRSKYQAVLLGINTIIKDNPHLGPRIRGRKDPLRIILDPHLKIPLESQVLRDNNLLIVTTPLASEKKIELLKQKGITILTFKNKKILLNELLNYLKDQEIISVLVEGGGKVLGGFVDEKLVDKFYLFYAPIIIGGEEGINAVGGSGVRYIKEAMHLKNFTLKKFDDNMLMIGYPTMF